MTTSFSSNWKIARGSWMRMFVSRTKCFGIVECLVGPSIVQRRSGPAVAMMGAMAHAGMAGTARLDGCRVLVTRPVQQAQAWQSALERLGAKVIAYPTIEVRPPASWQPLDDAFARLS